MKLPTICFVFAWSFAVLAGDVVPMYGARLGVPDAGVTLVPNVWTPEWSCHQGMGGLQKDKDGFTLFSIYPYGRRDGESRQLAGRTVCKQEGEAVRVFYSLTPNRDIVLNQLCLSADFPLSVFGGGRIAADRAAARIPVECGAAQFFAPRAAELKIADGRGRLRLALSFDRPVSMMFQDNRHWGGDTVSLRVFLGHDKPFRAGTDYSVSFLLSDGGPTTLAADLGRVTITAGPDWIPLKAEADIEPGSALDFSALRGTEAPAGRYGRPVARGGHFEFENLPGVPQRFYGVNVCGDANTPDFETARRFARRLARVGYNALRFHHHESVLVRPDGVTLDEAQMKRFDGLVAACVENGIYMTTDLFVSRRPISYRSIGIDRDGLVQMGEFKELVQVHEGAFRNYLQFARNFLGHRNPYTGRTLAEEPAMGWLSLVNEGNLGNHGMRTMRQFPVFRERWQAWLAERKAADPSFAAIPDSLPDSLDDRSSAHVQAFALFLQQLERRFAARVTAFLRDEMKCRALTTNMNCWHYPAVYQLPRANSYDYVDDHFYVDHPRFLETPWQLPSRCPNRNPMLGANMGAQALAMRRILNRPFTITEYNYSGPGRFRGVGGIACGAAAALQDWSGLWRFAWSHGVQGVKGPKGLSYFDMSGDPLGLASERASICLFLRRDLAPLTRTYAFVLPPKALSSLGPSPMMRTSFDWLSWYAKTGSVVADAAPADATWSARYPECLAAKSADVRQTVFAGAAPAAGDGAVRIDSESGTFLLETARTCGGFAEGGVIAAGALTADLGKSAATLWASSLDGRAIRASDHLLVTHLTDVQNSDIAYADRELTTLLDWGHLPHLMRAGKAAVRIAVPAGTWTVHVLAQSGARRRTVPCAWKDGELAFTADIAADPADASYLYELVRQP
ncbi:MAG: hypothetical protein ACI4Q3_08135 [Kiritimatiellia bacterium]